MSSHQVKGYVKKALEVQQDRFNEQMSGKDAMLYRQKKIMIAQREHILELQNKANEAANKHRPEDTIKLEGIEQIKALEAEDKLKVLEFLVKEMMELKAERRPRERVYYDPEMSERTDEAEERHRPVSSKRQYNKNSKQYRSAKGSKDMT